MSSEIHRIIVQTQAEAKAAEILAKAYDEALALLLAVKHESPEEVLSDFLTACQEPDQTSEQPEAGK